MKDLQRKNPLLPPALAEEVIFLVATVHVCVRLSVRPTGLNFGTHTKFKGQGHQGQKCTNSSFQPSTRKYGSRSHKRSRLCDQGRRLRLQGSKSKVAKVKV